MESITFNITNNAWINNGLSRLIIELETNFSEEVSVNMINNTVEIYSNSEKDVLEYISEVVSYLAAFGTYNFSTSFKLINLNSDSNYKPNCPYPKVPEDLKKIDITKEDKEILKKFNISDKSTKQKIWKMRMSYLGVYSKDSYFDLGINFKNTDVFKKLSEETSNGKICPNCGSYVNNLIEVRRFFNPLMNEHHNNNVEGFGAFRKNISFCPKCVLLSCIALFDKYIPFYQTTSKQEVFLALPNTYNVKILRKISRNLSIGSQFTDFSDINTTSYKSNIKNFRGSDSYSLALLNLLHNIKNNFSEEEVTSLFENLDSKELIEIVEWIFINKNSFNISRIKANPNIYKILESCFDPKNNREIYLVTEFFNKINFKNDNYNVEEFFNSFLNLDANKISKNLFKLFKLDKNSKVNFTGKSYTLYLFKNVFLNKILEESLMLDDNLKKSCRDISNELGKSFYKDISLLSKFAYATDKQIFNQIIAEALFLMAKKSALSNESFYLNKNDLNNLFDEITDENFNDIKSYFVSFMSVGALYQKYLDDKNEKKGVEK